MKANELRIGSIVGNGALHKGWPFLTISELKETVVMFKEVVVGEYYKDISPIPLTVEWLQKFGFEEYDHNEYVNIQYNLAIRLPDNAVLFKNVSWFCISAWEHPCKYVHQLQNLFFALTGEELTLSK